MGHAAAISLIPAPQAEVAAFLQGYSGADPVLTHISALFRGPDEVLKLKLAVRLGFLDFTELATRERLLRRELALNQRSVPGLYRGVDPVVRGPGGLALGGDGEVVDWVLRMARVADTDFLDVRAERGLLDAGLLTGLADAVAAMHAGQEPIGSDDHPGAMRRVLDGNAAAAADAGIDAAEWAADLAERLQQVRERLEARAGLVRRAHGDLHLGNVLLWHGRPAPFDALEFDEALATIDPAYDIAFLLMDLEQRVSRAAANLVLNRYVARTGDAGLPGVLAPYLSLRAMIRAHVEARKGSDPAALVAAARGYLQAVPGGVLAVGGLMGSGKSTLARALAPEFGPAPGALVVRSDEVRKRLFGVAPEGRLPAAAYDEAAHARTRDAMAEQVRAAASGGHAVIADATFLDASWADRMREAAGAAPFAGIWLEVPLLELERRVAARKGDASDADLPVLRAAHRQAAPPPGWTVVGGDEAEAEGRRLLAFAV